jgi:DNA-binding NtrC family response regulator
MVAAAPSVHRETIMAMATLLVVDDDPSQRELYTRRLERMGYAVLSAPAARRPWRSLPATPSRC